MLLNEKCTLARAKLLLHVGSFRKRISLCTAPNTKLYEVIMIQHVIFDETAIDRYLKRLAYHPGISLYAYKIDCQHMHPCTAHHVRFIAFAVQSDVHQTSGTQTVCFLSIHWLICEMLSKSCQFANVSNNMENGHKWAECTTYRFVKLATVNGMEFLELCVLFFFFFRLPLLALVYHSDCQMGIGWLQGSTRRVYCYPSQWTIDQLECKCKGEACEDVNVEQDLVIRPNQVRLPRTPAYGTISDAVRCDIPND